MSNSVVIGINSKALGNNCVVVGANLVATKDNQLLIGTKEIRISGILSKKQVDEIVTALKQALKEMA